MGTSQVLPSVPRATQWRPGLGPGGATHSVRDCEQVTQLHSALLPICRMGQINVIIHVQLLGSLSKP